MNTKEKDVQNQTTYNALAQKLLECRNKSLSQPPTPESALGEVGSPIIAPSGQTEESPLTIPRATTIPHPTTPQSVRNSRSFQETREKVIHFLEHHKATQALVPVQQNEFLSWVANIVEEELDGSPVTDIVEEELDGSPVTERSIILYPYLDRITYEFMSQQSRPISAKKKLSFEETKEEMVQESPGVDDGANFDEFELFIRDLERVLDEAETDLRQAGTPEYAAETNSESVRKKMDNYFYRCDHDDSKYKLLEERISVLEQENLQLKLLLGALLPKDKSEAFRFFNAVDQRFHERYGQKLLEDGRGADALETQMAQVASSSEELALVVRRSFE